MHPSPKNLVIAVLGVAVIGLGTVVALDHTGAAPAPQVDGQAAAASVVNPGAVIGTAAAGHGFGRQAAIGWFAQELGVTPAQLKTDIQNGETLDTIAGPKATTVKADLLAYVTKELDRARSKGAISSSQEASLINDASDAIGQAFAAQLGKLFPGA